MNVLRTIPRNRPVLIVGPTASGKSALALAVAERDRRQIVNADALQVFENWRILTARPSPEDEARAPHRLYGHVAGNATYSVGAWLADVMPLLSATPPPVIVGGTGLYFTALTEGLAEIPPVPADIRAAGQDRLELEGLSALLNDIDAETRSRIDCENPARVLRAWEVLRATGEGLARWQDRPAEPVLALEKCYPIVIDAPREWLSPRIASRFANMLAGGALDEARRNMLEWNPALQSSRAIGAADLIAHLRGEMSLDVAQERAVIATRQYAKRQRTWLRARMKHWSWLRADDATPA